MRGFLVVLLTACLLAVFGCGSVSDAKDDAAAGDDAGGATEDAGPADAGQEEAQFKPSKEINSGGARVKGSVYTVDVQLGQPFSQEPSTGGGKTAEGASAVKE